jgi:propionate CoA-transferase
MGLSLKLSPKVCSADEAAALIKDGDCITISGTVAWMLPNKVLRALEVRFLGEGRPNGLTWFDPFPTGVPGIEPLSYPGLLKRVIGGWYTPHPRLREMIVANEVEAYLYPLGSLSFWGQAMAAGRDFYLTKVGVETFLDPRNGGGKLNDITKEDLVSLIDVNGEPHICYKQLRIDVALIRGTIVD